MTRFKALFAAFLVAASVNAFAADWSMVSSSVDERVFVDSQSLVKAAAHIVQVRILENFAGRNDMGHGVYEHMSRIMLVAVDREKGAMGHQQWSLNADALGSSPTVWADNMLTGPAYFRPRNGSGDDRVVRTACNSAIAVRK
jgi:hypothetical protein